MDDFYLTSGSAALVSAVLLQLAKNAKAFTFLSRDTGKLNAILSVIVAGIAALGVSYSYNYDATTGVFSLAFTGTVSSVLHGIGHWIGQWSAQHGFYKGMVVPAEILGEIRKILMDALEGKPPQVKTGVPPLNPPDNP